MTTVTRIEWGAVTIVEHDALKVIRREDSEALVNAYWDGLNASGKVVLAQGLHDDGPTRLNSLGERWLAELRETCRTTLDERELIKAAREFIQVMGTCLAIDVTKKLRRW